MLRRGEIEQCLPMGVGFLLGVMKCSGIRVLLVAQLGDILKTTVGNECGDE